MPLMNIYLEAYGCTANKNDESIILGIVDQAHHTIVDHSSQADVIILVTCTVIGTTEQRMLSRIRKFKHFGEKLIITGCMASVQADLLGSIAPHAKLVPPENVQNIDGVLQGKKILTKKKKTLQPRKFSNLCAPICIAEGCFLSCTYCITHFARGPLRSFPSKEILYDVRSALKQGCKEIQITAQDTASYGYKTKYTLGNLLSEICSLKGDFRIRVGMMNPYTTFQNLDTIISAYDHIKIYKFLHLPVQSGDDAILEKMNRKYTVEEFCTIVHAFRKRYTNLTLSTDIIAGFPSESEEQFENSINLLQTIRPDIVNITRYSARPYTKAKQYPNRIPTDIVKQRSKKITEICLSISKEINLSYIGKRVTALILRKENNKSYIGRAENYKPVMIHDEVSLGHFYPIEIIDATPTHFVGNLI